MQTELYDFRKNPYAQISFDDLKNLSHENHFYKLLHLNGKGISFVKLK